MLRSHIIESENIPLNVRIKMPLFLQKQLNWYRNTEQSELDIFYRNVSADIARVTINFPWSSKVILCELRQRYH
jgi:hypothetical protein